MARARGANALLALAFETTYGTPPGSGFFQVPFVAEDLGDEQGRIASDLLGLGRDPQRPDLDLINNRGNLTVPVDLRNLGLWLKGLFGPPTTLTGVAATGQVVFSAQPTNNSIVTVNGSDFTFVTGTPTAGQAKIGATLSDTLANLVLALNASADVNVTPASYRVDADGATVKVTYDTLGTGGNAFTLAVGTSPDPHAVVSGATLAGGSASGPKNHVFVAGALSLPSLAAEVGNPEVPAYYMNYGVSLDTIQIALQRSGLLNAVIGYIAKGEQDPAGSSAAGSPTTLTVERFSQFIGEILRDGVQLGDLVSGQARFGNGLDPNEVIRPDGRINGADAGQIAAGLTMAIKLKDTVFDTLSRANTAIEVRIRWQIAAGKSLEFLYHYVDLPKPKRAVSGPGGILATYEAVASKHPTLGKTLTVTLINDVASY